MFAMRTSFRKCGFRRLCRNSAEGDGNATVGDPIEDNVRNITESIENGYSTVEDSDEGDKNATIEDSIEDNV